MGTHARGKWKESELGVRGDWWPVCKSTRL